MKFSNVKSKTWPLKRKINFDKSFKYWLLSKNTSHTLICGMKYLKLTKCFQILAFHTFKKIFLIQGRFYAIFY